MTALYKLDDVSLAYVDGFELSHVNLEIESGQITSIVGPNGSGKTTLLNILSFLDRPNSGKLHFKNERLNDHTLSRFKKAVGYVQQNPYLLRGTTRNNVELGLKLRHIEKNERHKQADEVMRILGIADLAEQPAKTLSGGEAQKVAIAQILVLEPEAIILDEPFTYLDKFSVRELEQLILKLQQNLGKTIILTTHNQYQAQWLGNKVYSVIKGLVSETQLINLFSGVWDKNADLFDTGKLKIKISGQETDINHIAIDPAQIVLSHTELCSSMQNSFQGKVTALYEKSGQVRVNILAEEKFQAIVSYQSVDELDIKIGADIWISFKSSSILLF